ncbi:MAG: universal stress protein [Bacteroidia bacterium]
MKTHEIKRILIPLDFSETSLLALEQGAYMARLFDAELYLLHVIEMIEFAYSIYDPSVAVPVDTEAIERNVEKIITGHAERIEKQYGLHIRTLIRIGRVATEVRDATEENEVDLVVMGTHGAKGFGEFFIGSNAHKTVTISSCPVLTVREHSTKQGFADIVMPIDNTLHSRQKVNLVIQLAKLYGARVHMLGLINKGEEDSRNKFMIKIEAVEKVLQHAGVTFTQKITEGENLAEETMKYAKEVNGDLIVIMTDHESKFTGMFLGAFAKQIINHSHIPVLSVRPLEGHYETVDLSASSNPFNSDI